MLKINSLEEFNELKEQYDLITEWREDGYSWSEIAEDIGKGSETAARRHYKNLKQLIEAAPSFEDLRGPKILLLDVETAPIIAHVWGLWDQRVGLNQIVNDSHMLSWTAKWLNDDTLYYMDQRDQKNISNDKALVAKLAKMIDEADIVVTQNGIQFDLKVIKARMIINGLKPIAGYKNFDIYREGKKHFRFTSHKLEYMAKALNAENKKLTTREFSGHSLWVECLKNNPKAWKEMEKYNKLDVIVLEELYHKIRPWVSGMGHDAYVPHKCTCGSTEFVKSGYVYLTAGKYQKLKCKSCGRITRDSTNLLSKEHRKTIKRQV